MPQLKKYTWLLVFMLSVSLLPWDSLHHLLDHHSAEIHHCEKETCLAEKELDCQLCAINHQIREVIPIDQSEPRFILLELIFDLRKCEFKHPYLDNPRNKAPPLA